MKRWKRAVSLLSAVSLGFVTVAGMQPAKAAGAEPGATAKAAPVEYAKTFRVATPGGVLRILDMEGNLLEELEDGESAAFPYGEGFSSPDEVRVEAIAEEGYLVDSYVTSWTVGGEAYEVSGSLYGIHEKTYGRGHYLASAKMDEIFTVSFTDAVQDSKPAKKTSRATSRAADPEAPAVGDTFTGNATVNYSGHPNVTYNGTGYINCTSGAFSGEDITLSNCASGHDFAAPQTGQTGVYTITVTKVDADKGIVECTVYWDNDFGTGGYQDLAGTYQYRCNPSGDLYIEKGISGSLDGFVRASSQVSLAATFGVYLDEACRNLVKQVKTDKNGDMVKDGLELEAGTYYVKEIKAPEGFALNETVKKVKVGSGASKSVTIRDKPIRAKVVGVKIDAATGTTTPTAGLSLQGAVYGVFSDAACTKQVAEGVTDASGNINFTNPYFLMGTYYIKELQAPEGYEFDPEVHQIEVDESLGYYEGSTMRLKDVGFTSADEPSTGWAKLKKVSANPDITEGNRCYSLEYATFSVTNALTGEVLPERLITDATGESQEIELPVGEYIVKEESAPDGFVKDLEEHRVTVRKNTTAVCTIENKPADDPVDLMLKKIDAETGKEVPTGKGTFQGAQYTIKYYDGQYQTEEDLAAVEPLRTWVLETNEDGKINFRVAEKVSGDEFYYDVETGFRTIPLGTITIQETKEPEGYKIDPTVYIRNIDAEAGTGELIISYQVAESPEPVVRGDLEGLKVSGGDMKRMADVPFQITSTTTGESHVVVTDENGRFSTASSWNPHSQNTNRGETSEDGVWFGSLDALDDGKGALPYDVYQIEELPCEANSDKVLLEPFLVTVSRDMAAIDLGTITNEYEPVPEIRTTAAVQDTGGHYGYAGETTVIVDTVEYQNLTKDEEYTLKGTLVDQETGEPLLAGGEAVAAEATFTASAAYGSVALTFAFDSSELKGKAVVAFERLYHGGKEAAAHTDLEDAGQTVTFLDPVLSTLAADRETGERQGFPDQEAGIVDEVSYQGLLAGKEYTVKGILMDKETGKPFLSRGEEVTAKKTFTADTPEGIQELTYAFDASALDGKDVVVFEALYYNGRKIAAHEDLEDAGQTVRYGTPKLATTARDQESGGHAGTISSQTAIIDLVEYAGLIPGKEYTIKGRLMAQETGEPVSSKGKEVTAEAVFTPEEAEGSLELSYSFDSQEWKGKSVVVFEALYYNGREIAAHEDLEDEGQTVRFGDEKLRTSAADQETGEHQGFPAKKSTIVDTVWHEGLTIGNTYTVRGILMEKKTGEPFLSGGREVTAETTFTATEAEGSVELTFTFDSSSLKGKAVVVFEHLYYEGREIASHADPEDEGQTVEYEDVKLGTSAAEKGTGKKEITTAKKTTVIDVVKYEGLIPGKEYTVKGTLMDKAMEKALLVDGKKVTAEKSFTPKEASGSVEIPFTFDSSALKGKTVVAFESLCYEGREIAAHADLKDQDQTVRFVEEETETKETTAPNKDVTGTGRTTVTPPKTGDNTRVILYVLLAAAAVPAAAATVRGKSRKKKQPEK